MGGEGESRLMGTLSNRKLKFALLFVIGLAALLEGNVDSSDVLLARLVLDI